MTKFAEGQDYRVVLKSVVEENADAAAAGLVFLLPIDAASAKQILKAAPIVLADKVTSEEAATAQSYSAYFNRLGMEMEIIPADAETSAKRLNLHAKPSFVTRPANVFICPTCGDKFFVHSMAEAAPQPTPARQPAAAEAEADSAEVEPKTETLQAEKAEEKQAAAASAAEAGTKGKWSLAGSDEAPAKPAEEKPLPEPEELPELQEAPPARPEQQKPASKPQPKSQTSPKSQASPRPQISAKPQVQQQAPGQQKPTSASQQRAPQQKPANPQSPSAQPQKPAEQKPIPPQEAPAKKPVLKPVEQKQAPQQQKPAPQKPELKIVGEDTDNTKAGAAERSGEAGGGNCRVTIVKKLKPTQRRPVAELISRYEGISEAQALRAVGKSVVTITRTATPEQAEEIKRECKALGVPVSITER